MCCMVNMAMLFMFLMRSGLSYELPGPGILRSLNKNVTGSSQHPELASFALSFAVDGSTSRDSSLCKCCAATKIQDNPWIQIDLGRLYRVATVEVIGRTDIIDPFNMAINVSATNTTSQGSTPTQETLPDVPEQYHNVTFSYPVIGQFVTLQLNGNGVLCVCEVNIYSKDCSNGTYGFYCNETCGQCQDGETCDFVTGRCTRCLPGYQLPLCTEECLSGTFGPDCSYICHCNDNTACDHVNGSCPDNKCDVGWQGSNCSLECLYGTFGPDCSALCHCKDNTTCDHVNGSCPDNKCDVGWQGSNCSLECEPGTFGQNCSSLCHCYENKACNHVTGRCPGDRCEVRWEGANCSLSTLCSRNAKVTGSSQYTATNSDTERFNLSHAVDGSTGMDPIACSCCASTASGNQPWIQIDLGRLYRVSIIDVIGRLNTSKPFVGMHIFIHTQQNNWTKTHNLQLTIPNVTEQVFIAVLKYPVIGQYVTLQLPDDNVILLVCEVSIYSNGCSAGRFGANCSFLCHCLENQTCDPATGECPKGKCASGWEGTTCSNTLISLNANVSASSIHKDPKFALARAVDGSTRTESGKCACCAATDREDEPWIQIDLGRLYRVAKVEVVSRTDWAWLTYFVGMHIYLHENRDHWTVNHALVRTVPNDGSRYYNTTFDNPVIAQYVTLQIPVNENVLVVCEVRIFSSYCSTGTYGLYCNETCGKCQNGETCDNVTGHCGQCLPGYQSPLCKKECLHQSFGPNCSSTCHCQGNGTCDHVNGSCPYGLCDLGWRGSSCSQDCRTGTYGLNCNETCGQCQTEKACDHVTGNCAQCLPGFLYPLCKDECPPGRFGLDCAAGCNCHKNQTCHHVTGECPDNICDVGWMGVNCSTECDNMTYGNNCAEECGHCYKESCDRRTGECSPCFDGYTGKKCVEVCPPGTFGSNCSSICHCYDNMACDYVAGSCFDGRCDLGWQGYNCSQACSPGTYGENCSLTCGHCRNGVPCDRILGTCHLCQPGYTGTTCHNATVIITNVTVSGSFENPDARYDLFYVVDGSNRTDSAVCNCCAATQRENDPWIQIDLGRLYMVATVEILGRTDFNDSLSGMNIYIHTNSTEWNQTLTFTETLSNETDQHYVTTSQHPVIGQYVTLEKPGNNVSLYVCEVTVYIQDCSPGTYGLYCNEACGQCLERETCDHVTGICTRCNPGYQLPLCKQKLKSTSPADNVQNPAGAIVGSVLAVICALIIVLIVIIRFSSKGVVKNKYLSAVVGRFSEISPSMIWRKMSDSDPGTPVEDADVISLHERAIEIPDDTDRRDLNNYDAPHIPVNMIWDYIRQEHSTDDGTILSEFKLLKKCPLYVSTFACLEENVPKNRYKGYQAYDHTRVRLVRTVGGETDYINANYIQGYERRNKFIASQGPTVVMVEDFWLMVVQQNCSIIVMLTNVFEMGVKKCLQYWPSVGQMKFGSISVSLLDEEEFPDYIIRRLEIKLTDDGPGHVVSQYHFVSWPDKDIPDNVWCLVNFWRAVDSKAASLTTPVLVHCSAGVGRTGTFIGLDCLFYQAEATGSVCPFEGAKKLRQQRMKMVQTPAQYVYLHEALAEAILFGTTSITQDQFEEQYEYMTTTGKDGTSGFGKQFKLISDSFEQVETVIEETEYSNVDWNVNGDGNVSTDACTTFAGVINLPMVTGPNSCLLVRSPGSDDAEMIWTIISKYSVSTVVMATSTTHPNYEVSVNLDVSDQWSNGSLQIQVVSCDEKSKRTSFCLNGTTKVTQFQIPGCEGNSPVPRDVNAVVDTLNSIQTWLEEQENSGRILIHCGDGTSTSGLIAVILNEILRMKLQNGIINIVESVKTMKAVEKNVVTSADQLQFCYDVVWAYLHPNAQEDVYMNV